MASLRALRLSPWVRRSVGPRVELLVESLVGRAAERRLSRVPRLGRGVGERAIGCRTTPAGRRAGVRPLVRGVYAN
jgi:hypothetical protein